MELIERAKAEGRCTAIWYAAVLEDKDSKEQTIHPHWLESDFDVLEHRTRTNRVGTGFDVLRRPRVAVIELPPEEGQ
jgi:hypothetical protein